MSVPERKRLKTTPADFPTFILLSKNMRDDSSFYVWISKLFKFNKGLTIKFMNLHKEEFTNPKNIEFYNDLLKLNRLERFSI
jgi:hypothetical protein